MRLLRILLLSLALLAVFIADLWAQTNHGCSQVVRLDNERFALRSVTARPKDSVVDIPFLLHNDSTVAALTASIQYDTSLMFPDTLDAYTINVRAAGRMVHTITKLDDFGNPYLDTVTNVQCVFAPDQAVPGKRYMNVVKILLLPSMTQDVPPKIHYDSIAPSPDLNPSIVAYVRFRLKPGIQQLEKDTIRFWQQDKIISVDTTVFPPDTVYGSGDCYGNELDEFYHNQTGDVSVLPIFPTLGSMQVVVFDSNYVPTADPTIDGSANPSSLPSGGGSTSISWTATNADSVIISYPGLTPSFKTTALTGSQSFSIGATTTFTITAKKGINTASKLVTVTVGGGGGTGNIPSISVPQVVYTINEGEPVGFAATITDPDVGDQVTLSASGVPSGATFAGATGATSASANFNWTPNFGQKGTYQVVFTGHDNHNNNATPVTVTIVVNELQFDRLFSSSSPPPKGKPVGGLRGTSAIMWPVNLVTSKVCYGVQYDLSYPDSMLRIDSIVLSGRIPDYAVYDNIGTIPGKVRVVTFGLNNEPVQNDTTTAIMWLACTLDSNLTPWTSAKMKLTDGWESVNPDPNIGSQPLETDTTGIIEVDSLGDVNVDHHINVADFVSMVAYIIGNFDLNRRQFATADCIQNDTVNVFDLVADINSIYGMPLPPAAPALRENAIVSLAYGDMQTGMHKDVTVTSELPAQVAGVEMELRYDPGALELGTPTLSRDDAKFALQYNSSEAGRMKVILYHLAPSKSSELIQAGTADLIKIPVVAKTNIVAGNKAQLRLTQLLLSTAKAEQIPVQGVDPPNVPSSFWLGQNYPNPFNPTTTIEFAVGGSQAPGAFKDVTLEIFNVLGQKVRTLVDSKLAAGVSYKAEWDGANAAGQKVASGIYLYRLRVDTDSQTKKMVLLK